MKEKVSKIKFLRTIGSSKSRSTLWTQLEKTWNLHVVTEVDYWRPCRVQEVLKCEFDNWWVSARIYPRIFKLFWVLETECSENLSRTGLLNNVRVWETPSVSYLSNVLKTDNCPTFCHFASGVLHIAWAPNFRLAIFLSTFLQHTLKRDVPNLSLIIYE